MATIVNAADVELQATSPRLVTIPGPTNTTTDFSQVTGATKPSNNADVTTTILTASGTSIVMTNAQLFKSSSGVGGVFIGSGGLVGKNGSGTTTFSINATTGAVTFTGSITGGSTLNITGSATFNGVQSDPTSGTTTAGLFNSSQGSGTGVVGISGNGGTDAGLIGVGDSSGGTGVSGIGVGASKGVSGVQLPGVGAGAAVSGVSFSLFAPGVSASHSSTSGIALEVLSGRIKLPSAQLGTGASTGTFVGTTKPGANSNNTWLRFQDESGAVYDIPAWPR